ncbi:MAG: acyl-CoA synthetase, partial [Alphaproteobacteria bacterium]|nr:acyl-CoA synthetase [Alphaproteobacteria bacterium]
MIAPAKSPYDTDLDRNAANYVPLSPLGFIERSAAVFPNRTAVVHGARRYSWAESYARCRRLASALAQRGIGKGDTVALMAPNVPEAFEAHFGVPMAGAVLNALNIRLDAETIAFILGHGEAKVLITDREFSPVIEKALALVDRKILVVDIDDALAPPGKLLGECDYESFIASGDPAFPWRNPGDEWDAIALNYTSGTTGNPKGVVYHHRGAYLNALGNVLVWSMPQHPIYLWTLPMFHCNGWCFPWTVTALAGTHVCLRRIEAGAIFEALEREKVSHLCGAPIIMNMLLNAPPKVKRELHQPIAMMTAGAAPPAAVIEGIEGMGFRITHVYGLTEVYGPVTYCAWHEEWNGRPSEERASLKARQGVNYPVLEGLMVADPHTLAPVPRDGATIGEVFMRGNVVMKGYLKNQKATEEAFAGGWFHTGDLGVAHPDGYIELKDRSKDIIISGGENISTIEVESVLFRHPAVL